MMQLGTYVVIACTVVRLQLRVNSVIYFNGINKTH